MKTTLILIRHGITEWNMKRKYAGLTDIKLSTKGLLQAKKLKNRLKRQHVDEIYVSDRKRAVHTARVIFGRRRITRSAGLREINFGIFEGLKYEEILKKHPLLYKKWLKNPFSVRIPRGEAFYAFKNRITGALKKIVLLHPGKTVAVICHGGVISIFLNSISGNRDFWRKIPAPASITIAECERNKVKINLFNDLSHLS